MLVERSWNSKVTKGRETTQALMGYNLSSAPETTGSSKILPWSVTLLGEPGTVRCAKRVTMSMVALLGSKASKAVEMILLWMVWESVVKILQLKMLAG
jgi:hypothetical protein